VRPRVLAVGGSDPSGGAGVQRDLVTLAELGCEVVTAITSITVQDAHRFSARFDVPDDVVARQIASARGVDAAKTGMLATAETVRAVVPALRGLPIVVVDPVLSSSTGARLLDEEAVPVLRDELLPIATVVTPNAREAAALTGVDVVDVASQRKAAEHLVALGARAAVVTGGDLGGADAIDVLACEGDVIELRHPRLPGSVHGSGCTFAAALAGMLARGSALDDACRKATEAVRKRFEP
jgi:hydroxymethylpyrimidine/phosphomethylpyrimidine kinase